MLQTMIFDCDGVLVDSEPVHLQMFQKVLAEEGIVLTRKTYFERYLAMDDRGCFTSVLADHGRRASEQAVADLVHRKAHYYEQEMRAKSPTFPGVVEFVRRVSSELPLAIASGALRHEVEQAIRSLGIADCFRCVVTAEDVVRGKPDPEAYLTALARLNCQTVFSGRLRPGDCLVIEDSVHGVRAAKRAGMYCLAVTNSYPGHMLSEADWIVSRLDEFNWQEAAKSFDSKIQ